MRIIRLVPLAVLALALLAACGGSSGGGKPTSAIKGSIVFASGKPGKTGIYVVTADGTHQVMGHAAAGPPSAPDWSHDAKRIAYIDDKGRLVAVNSDGSNGTALTPGVNAEDPLGDSVSEPVWTPDGRISFLYSHTFLTSYGTDTSVRLVAAKPNGTGLKPITDKITTQFDWSPNGKQIAFSPTNTRIAIYDVATNRIVKTLKTAKHFRGEGLAWSPDGTRIAFVGLRDIFVIRANGSGLRALKQPGSECCGVAWSPDGKQLAYSSDQESEFSGLWVMNANGTGAQKLIGFDHAIVPDWTAAVVN